MVVALYIVVLYLTQSVSFGAYQIRIATSLYALAYAFPFLVIPMGIGNLISNFLFGGSWYPRYGRRLWRWYFNNRYYRRYA
nr:QueT transporter family protein [Veillonella rogosae]